MQGQFYTMLIDSDGCWSICSRGLASAKTLYISQDQSCFVNSCFLMFFADVLFKTSKNESSPELDVETS